MSSWVNGGFGALMEGGSFELSLAEYYTFYNIASLLLFLLNSKVSKLVPTTFQYATFVAPSLQYFSRKAATSNRTCKLAAFSARHLCNFSETLCKYIKCFEVSNMLETPAAPRQFALKSPLLYTRDFNLQLD